MKSKYALKYNDNDNRKLFLELQQLFANVIYDKEITDYEGFETILNFHRL